MRARSILTPACLVFASILAGCSGPDQDATGPSDPTGEPLQRVLRDGRTVIHGAPDEVLQATLETYDLLAGATGTYHSIGAITFEPTLGSTSSGALFMTSLRRSDSVPPDRGTHIIRSADHGATWQDVGPFLPTGETSQLPNSNDPMLVVDASTDRVLKFDMHAVTCMTLEWSDDDGESWSPPVGSCGAPPIAQDHQTLVAAKPRGPLPPTGYDNVLVYCVNRVLNVLGSWCSTSTTGGVTWSPLVPGYPAGTPQCIGVSHHLESNSEGMVFRPGQGCEGPTVWRSVDDGVTWTEHPIAPGEDMMGHDVALAVDEVDQLHALWISSDGLPFLASSRDLGETWTEPVMAGAPGVTAAGFPAISAGAPGRVALAYVGTTAPGGYEAQGDRDWSGYLGVTLDALAPTPSFVTVTVNDPASDPISGDSPEGACGNTRCGGLGDFIDMTIDPEGRPHVALAHNFAGEAGIVGTLAEGPALRGPLAPLPPLALGEPLRGA